ncbi:hypothetical protein T08_8528 [Trichinella sp. T8]|nr:hypothetical protein T08_8528 [Trichinella sp. T8]
MFVFSEFSNVNAELPSTDGLKLKGFLLVILRLMYHKNVSGRSSSDLRTLLLADFIRRVSFGNNGRRELKETPSSNWKIPCQTIMFGVSEKRPSSN